LAKSILIGITRISADGSVLEQIQLHGKISLISKDKVVVRLASGEDYQLPPDFANICPATPGEYKLRFTGEVVVNPDDLATLEIHEGNRDK
jgi:hypothetical protein